jgi:hypothetical protein
MKLSNYTAEILYKAGWYIEREIDTVKYTEFLKKEGFEVNSAAVRFFAKFGGLEVLHPDHKIKGKNDKFIIDPMIISNYHAERIMEYEERVGEKLTPIGKASNGYMVLTMSQTGKVYAGYDDFLLRIGLNGYEALETLCEGIIENKIVID